MAPDGKVDRKVITDRFSLTLGPRDPVGEYTLTLTTEKESIDEKIEVRHASRPILRAGRLHGRIDGDATGSTVGTNELNLFGFPADAEVMVGLYAEDSESMSGTLVGLEEIRSDEMGRAAINVSLTSASNVSCLHAVAGVDDLFTGRSADVYELDGETYIGYGHPRHEIVCP